MNHGLVLNRSTLSQTTTACHSAGIQTAHMWSKVNVDSVTNVTI